MRWSFPLLICALGCLAAGCGRRARVNSNCEWPAEPRAGRLDPGKPADRRHLSADAEFAEDLAIRYADAHGGARSGHFEGFAEYARMRNRCMATLFQAVAAGHGVSDSLLYQSLGRRPPRWDTAVMLSFAVLYVAAVLRIVRAIRRRHADDPGSLGAVVMTVYVSLATSAVGVLAGEQWVGLLESVRLDTGHLSYRGARIPWGHHRLALFLAGIAVFWLIAVLRRRPTEQRS